MKKIKIWDLFTRLSHWLLVLLVLSAYLTAEFGDVEMQWHFYNGMAVLILVLSRVVWAFVGSSSARLSHFLCSPITTGRYLLALLRGSEKRYIGHNPAGSWMVVLLWLLLIMQPLAGLFSSDDIIAEGPLAYGASSQTVEMMTAWHHRLFDLLLVLVAIHIAAVLFHWWVKKEDLIKAMFSGEKLIPAEEPVDRAVTSQKLVFRPFYLALMIVAVIAGLVLFAIDALS